MEPHAGVRASADNLGTVLMLAGRLRMMYSTRYRQYGA